MQLILRATMLMLMMGLLFNACEEAESDEDELLVTDVYTSDINEAPQFFDFEDEDFSETVYDLTFSLGSMEYLVGLNSTAGVLAFGTDTIDFSVEDVPAVGYAADSSAMVIGSSWMDLSTYNPSDHSIASNQMIYFIRTVDYQWVKLRIVSATPSQFNIEYTIYTDGSGYGSVESASVAYASGAPTHFSLSSGLVTQANSWDMTIATTPEFSTELETNFFMPTLLFNHEKGIEVAIIDGMEYSAITEVPENLTWIMDSSSDHSFGNGGMNQVLVYHPEPPYNHKVIVENPALVYLVRTSSQTYKVQFKEYSSGIVVFAYDAL